jgi:3,4-dihydroxy 2-butanone 4-phosphate synthase/GTP cyclohydrolase II
MSQTASPDSLVETGTAPSMQEDAATPVVVRVASSRLPTIYGEFDITAYHDLEGKEHLVIRNGPIGTDPVPVRLHSECLTGDVLGSVRCDCREQLHATLQYIARAGRGVLVYLRQEGRGIGLANKVRAYALQDQGMDTVEANLHLGFPADGRSYGIAAAMLLDQGIAAVRLMTNNPRKVTGLEAYGINVAERIPHEIPARSENQYYLKTKAAKLGHLLQL